MITIILSAIIGYFAHKKFRPISDQFPGGWDIISNYSAGGVLVILLFPLFYLCEFRKMNHGFGRAIFSLVLTFFSIGGGTVAGWLSDTSLKQSRGEKHGRKTVGSNSR